MKFHLDEQYLALSLAQRTHVALDENTLNKNFSRGESSAEIKTCALSYNLQKDNMYSVCEHRVYMTTSDPALIKYGSANALYSLKPHQAFFRFKRGTNWETSNYSLEGSRLQR
jgi:hypothetical protein